jgi:SAM-dependent methyltransferase
MNTRNALDERTRESFGYQWTAFGTMTEQFRADFLNYIYPVREEFFAGKRGLDAGCGFGRHLYYAARFGASMVGLDFSRAIRRAHEIAGALECVRLIQGDLRSPPFRAASFDFVYSLGVLHHTPDPEAGFRALATLVRPGGAIFIWVYSKSRGFTNAVLEMARRITSRLPLPLIRGLSFLAAVIDWIGFIAPYRLARRSLGDRVDQIIWPRVKLYAAYPFQVVYADWFDRLSAPIRFYYDSNDMEGWAARAGLINIRISPTGLYGWRLYGEMPSRVGAGPSQGSVDVRHRG